MSKPEETKKLIMTKVKLVSRLGELTGLPKAQVVQVLDALPQVIREGLIADGVFTLAGMLRITTLVKAPREERWINNPWKPGEKLLCKARPAKKFYKFRPLQALKDIIGDL